MRGFGWGSVWIYFVLCSLKAKGKKEGVLESDTVFPRRDLRKTQSRSTQGVSPL